ncbi:hypothetical protein ACHAXT_002544 [Thalassiosira profunda]
MVGETNDSDFDIQSVDGKALTPYISGAIGLSITSVLWLISSWRLVYHYSGWCSKCCPRSGEESVSNGSPDSDQVRTEGLTTKRILHGLLWLAMTVEGVAYADMVATNASNKLNYTLLDIIGRGILEFSTFVIGTVHWFGILARAGAGGAAGKRVSPKFYPLLLLVTTIAVTVCSVFEAVALLSGGYESVHDFRSRSRIHRVTLIVESAGWGTHAVVVAICGGMVHRRVKNLPTFSQVRSEARRAIVHKMIVPIVFCGLCYALRAGWMAADFVSRIQSPETTFEAGLGWWIGNCWIPTFIPSVMLLYSIRRRDREPGEGMGEPLIQSSQAQDGVSLLDPFQSFSQTLRDFEEEEESLTSGK